MVTPLQRAGRSAFTLIELLVVVTIMGLLMAVGIPAFQNVGRGAGVDAAAGQLRGTIALARQWAISNRERVYIVFPADDPRDRENHAYRSFNVFSPTDGYLRDWIVLREGTVFNDTRSPTTNIFQDDLPNLGDVNSPFGFAASHTQPGLVARPDGRVERPNSPTVASRIYLMEGWIQGGLPYEKPGANTLYRTLRVRAVTGGIDQYDYAL